MKLSTRIVVSYLLVFVVPIMLILAMVMGLAKYSLGSMQKKLDLDSSSYEMILNPMSMMGHIAATQVARLRETIREEPEKLLDEEFLSDVNDALSRSYSTLVVHKGDTVVFYGRPAGDPYKNEIY